MTEQVWYRYYDHRGSYGFEVVLEKVPVVKETPKGVWLDDYGQKKFCLKDARRRWAYPTVELAKNSFEIRKRKQLQHLQRQIDHVKAVVEAIDNGTVYQKKEPEGIFAGLEGFGYDT